VQQQIMKKLLLAASIAIAITGFSQKINNKLVFQKGQKLEMTIQINSTVSSALGESKVDATVVRIFDVIDASNAGATIEHKIKRVKMNFDSPMGKDAFDSENEQDMKSEGGKQIEKSLKDKYTMTLDPTGKITDVKKDDDNPNTAEKDAGANMIANALSQVAEGMKLPETGDKTDFKILPEREISKGESWTDSSENRKTVYTLADLTENDIIITFTEDATVNRKQEAGGMEIKVNSKEKTTGRLTLDRKTELLKEKSSTTDSEGTMEVMGQTAPLNTKTSKNWVVTSR
jgi:hypothetical protein